MSKEKQVTKLRNEIEVLNLKCTNLRLESSKPLSEDIKLELERLDLLIKTKQNELARMKLKTN